MQFLECRHPYLLGAKFCPECGRAIADNQAGEHSPSVAGRRDTNAAPRGAEADDRPTAATAIADHISTITEIDRLRRGLQASHKETSEATAYQKATSDVLAVISRSPTNLQPVLDAIVETAAGLCQAEFAIFFKKNDGQYHVTANNSATTEAIVFLRNNPFRETRGSITGRAGLTQQTVHVTDVLLDPEFVYPQHQQAVKFRSVLAVPLLLDGAVLGVIFLARTAVKPFSNGQINLVTTFANQAVIAINNVRLFEELQARTADVTEALEYQTATAEVLGVISKSPNELQPVLNAIVQTAKALCTSDRAVIWLLRDKRFVLGAHVGLRARPDFS